MMRLVLKITRPLLGASLTLLAWACGPAPGAPVGDSVPDTPAVCEAGVALPALEVTPSLAVVGEQANVITEANGALWIVESGSNTISRFDPETERFDEAFIDVGNDRGPYDIYIDDDRAWITNYLSNSLTIADTNSGEVLSEVIDPRLDDPSGVGATSRHVYVTNVEFEGVDQGWARGSILVLDRERGEILGELPAAAKNPQYVTVIDEGGEGRPAKIAIVSTGALGQVDGKYVQTSDAAIEIWTEGEDALSPTREVYTLPPPEPGSRVGAPGRALVTPDGSRLYMTSATAPVVFSIDLEEGAWARGAKDPIVLYEEDADTLHAGGMGEDGLLWVVSFNQDAIYALDTRCDALLLGPLSVGMIDQELEGPIGAVAANGAGEAYFVTSLSKRLGKIMASGR